MWIGARMKGYVRSDVSEGDLQITTFPIVNETQKGALCPVHLSPGTWVRLLKRVASAVGEGAMGLQFMRDC